MRLVDADYLKSLDKHDVGFALWIDNQPIAFDLDDIVNKMAERRDTYYRLGMTTQSNVMQEAIEMMRND